MRLYGQFCFRVRQKAAGSTSLNCVRDCDNLCVVSASSVSRRACTAFRRSILLSSIIVSTSGKWHPCGTGLKSRLADAETRKWRYTWRLLQGRVINVPSYLHVLHQKQLHIVPDKFAARGHPSLCRCREPTCLCKLPVSLERSLVVERHEIEPEDNSSRVVLKERRIQGTVGHRYKRRRH